MRIGLGYDLHPLVEGRPLVLGGVTVPYSKGLAGHSDADVLTHAVVDAVLGAAALGTIGEHFPDTDERYRGAFSLDLLAAAAEMLKGAGYRLLNVDSVVVAAQPRLQAHLGAMASLMAERLGVATKMVSVKATSPEGLGSLGRLEGIAAQAVALVEEI